MTPSALPTLTQVKSAALYAALFCWRTIKTAYEEIGQTDRASPRGDHKGPAGCFASQRR